MSEIIARILSFVETCGGIERVRDAVSSLKKIIADDTCQKFLTNISKDKLASKQIVAVSLLGFALSQHIYEEMTKEQKKEYVN